MGISKLFNIGSRAIKKIAKSGEYGKLIGKEAKNGNSVFEKLEKENNGNIVRTLTGFDKKGNKINVIKSEYNELYGTKQILSSKNDIPVSSIYLEDNHVAFLKKEGENFCNNIESKNLDYNKLQNANATRIEEQFKNIRSKAKGAKEEVANKTTKKEGNWFTRLFKKGKSNETVAATDVNKAEKVAKEEVAQAADNVAAETSKAKPRIADPGARLGWTTIGILAAGTALLAIFGLKKERQVTPEPEKSEPEKSEPEKSEPEKSEPEKSEPEKSEPEKSEPEKAEVKKADNKKSEAAKTSTTGKDAKAEPEKAEVKKADNKKSEAAKTSTTGKDAKAEPEKAEVKKPKAGETPTAGKDIKPQPEKAEVKKPEVDETSTVGKDIKPEPEKAEEGEISNALEVNKVTVPVELKKLNISDSELDKLVKETIAFKFTVPNEDEMTKSMVDMFQRDVKIKKGFELNV